MAKTADIIRLIENFAPLEIMEEWDNSGFQVNLHNEEVNKVLLALNIDENTVNQAVFKGCDMIISHHPLIFKPLNRIEEPFVIKAIQNNIQIYSAHTNLDKAMGGTTDKLIEKLGYKNAKNFNDFVKTVEIDEYCDLSLLTQKIKEILGIPSIKIAGELNKEIKKIAFGAGSCGSFISDFENTGIDLFITGEVKYHEALDAKNITIFDLGHFYSEKCVTEIFKDILEKENVEIVIANEKDIWEFV